MRDLKSDKTNHIKRLPNFSDFKEKLELVEMDLNDHSKENEVSSIVKAIKGSDYVIHTAISMEPDPTEDGPQYQEEVMK